MKDSANYSLTPSHQEVDWGQAEARMTSWSLQDGLKDSKEIVIRDKRKGDSCLVSYTKKQNE